MELIHANGVALSAACLGGAGLDSATPAVLLHGLVFGNMASWYFPLATPLSAQRPVWLYDQRGHGDSSMASSGFDLATQAHDLRAVMDFFSGARAGGLSRAENSLPESRPPVDLVGHSMGALIALHFALQYPERVRRLVLIDAPVPANEHVAPSVNAVRSAADIDHFVHAHAQGSVTGRRRERLRARLNTLLFASSLVADINAMSAPASTDLAALNVPVLLLYGRQSPCLSAGEWLQTQLLQATLQAVNGGHYLLEENPAEVLAAIESFLSAAAGGL